MLTVVREYQLCKSDVIYGLQSDNLYAVCTLTSIFLRTVVPKLLQGLPPSCETEVVSKQGGPHALHGEYRWIAVSAVSVIRVWTRPEKNWIMKEINGS